MHSTDPSVCGVDTNDAGRAHPVMQLSDLEYLGYFSLRLFEPSSRAIPKQRKLHIFRYPLATSCTIDFSDQTDSVNDSCVHQTSRSTIIS